MESSVPSSVLIIGSGVFGLSTAYELSRHTTFRQSRITLVDRSPVPNPHGSSIDSSRIIRADYASAPYATLATTAQHRWRNEEWGANGRYYETGLALTADIGLEDYVLKSLENVKALEELATARGEPVDRPAEVLPTTEDIKHIIGTGGASGDLGYVNWRSGWADAEAAMVHLARKVQKLKRVEFVTDTVTKLLFSSNNDQVIGAKLASGKTLSADLTIIAAGAWTPALLDMRGLASATGQVLAYTKLTQSERKELASVPILLNITAGLFHIPPDNYGVLKVARHSYGYSNPTTIENPEPHASPDKVISVSLPPTTPPNMLPLEARRALYQYQRKVFPNLSFRPFDHTRICWYTDTATGDWIIAYHPSYNKSLFVATGGSGHAFKFLPIIGEKIVQNILGTLESVYVELWKWPERRSEADVYTADGSRNGRKGMTLDEELKVGEESQGFLEELRIEYI